MLLGIGGGVAAVSFFSSTDDATQSEEAVKAAVPGEPSSGAEARSETVRKGNVVVSLPKGFRSAAARLDEIYGPDTVALQRTGQAVVLRYRKDAKPPIRAFAFGHVVEVDSVDDPRLRGFIDYWLGRPAS